MKETLFLMEQAESEAERAKIAAIALSHATHMTEWTCRALVSRIQTLRQAHDYTDPDMLRLIEIPRKVGIEGFDGS